MRSREKFRRTDGAIGYVQTKQYLDPELLASTQQLLNWILTEGQEFNEELEYTKIPEDVTETIVCTTKDLVITALSKNAIFAVRPPIEVGTDDGIFREKVCVGSPRIRCHFRKIAKNLYPPRCLKILTGTLGAKPSIEDLVDQPSQFMQMLLPNFRPINRSISRST